MVIRQTESDRVFVRGTLQNSDRVIVNGNHRLVTGQLVRPVGTTKISTSLSFAMGELASHPDIFQKAQAIVDTAWRRQYFSLTHS